jgi:uncharacterized Zn finger protein (UPF0148 family)
MISKIVKCTCSSSFQDELYGLRNRMTNEMKSGQYRCTVCGTVIGSKDIAASQKAVVKEAVKEIVKEPVKKVISKKEESLKESPKKGKIDKKSSMKGGKR